MELMMFCEDLLNSYVCCHIAAKHGVRKLILGQLPVNFWGRSLPPCLQMGVVRDIPAVGIAVLFVATSTWRLGWRCDWLNPDDQNILIPM
jgi:hypothetical protein